MNFYTSLFENSGIGTVAHYGAGEPGAEGTVKQATFQSDMVANRSMPPGIIIPELVYSDVGAVVTWLCQTFGFKERLRIGNHRAQLVFGEASVIVVGQSEDHIPATPDVAAVRPLSGELTHSLMVRVADVDQHYAHVKQSGARVLTAPETYQYGERQYTVIDPGGHRWTFTQSVADVDPEAWGGQLVAPYQGETRGKWSTL